jgi:hypothetical protein
MAEDDARERPGGAIETAPLADVLGQVLRRLVRRGRSEIGKAADQGRHRLELRQLHRDRDAFWIRLGKTAYRLAESGELDHPAITKAMTRIDALDERIRALEAGRTDPGEPEAEVEVDGDGADR